MRRGSRLHLPVGFWPLAALALLAFLVRLVPVLRGGGLEGVVDYDDGVYFGAAVALVHGVIAYRDFLLLHPPGILYLLSPFAGLGTIANDRVGLAAARLAFMCLGALNTVLVGLVAGRLGRREMLCAAALYAVWDDAAIAERATWLIAPQTTLALLALLALSVGHGREDAERIGVRRAAFAGAALGGAVGIQLWEVVPFAIVLAFIAWRSRSATGAWIRPALAYASAGGLVLAVVCAPFLLAAGSTMLRYVVADQVGRAGTHFTIMSRLQVLEGLPSVVARAGSIASAATAATFVAVVLAVAAVAWQRPRVRLWAVLFAVEAAILLVHPVFFGHYKAWIAPAGALSIGAAAATIIGWLEARGRWAGVGAHAAVGLTLGLMLIGAGIQRTGARFPVTTLDAELAGARCVAADSPILLIETDTLSRDLAAHCPLKLDPSGTSYDVDATIRPDTPRSKRPQYQQTMASYYASGDAALFQRLSSDGLSAQTWALIRRRLPIDSKAGPAVVLLGSRR